MIVNLSLKLSCLLRHFIWFVSKVAGLAALGQVGAMVLLAGSATAQVKFGMIGDSLLDEHFDQGIGYSKNAMELVVTSGRIDLGPKGNWADTRRTGYEYNWALAGSTTTSLLADNQHVSLANQITSKGITRAIMVIGANDFFPVPPSTTPGAPKSVYEILYEGLATPAQVNEVKAERLNNILTAAQTLKNTGVSLVVATIPDYGISPFARNFYADPIKRDRVDSVVQSLSIEAANRLTTVHGIPVVDLYGLTKDIWGDHGAESTVFKVGGVDLNLQGTGGVPFSNVLNGTFNPNLATSDTLDAFVHDGIHPNSAIGGVFANVFLTAFNQEYGDSLQLFTEREILQNAGPNLGAMYSRDTLVNSLNGKTYGSYVISAVPEPGSAILLTLGCLAFAVRRRLATSNNR